MIEQHRVEFDFIDKDQDCAYLSNKKENIHYKIIYSLSNQELSRYIKHGWRRFGALLHRPACEECNECKSLRVDVDNFRFTKSSRRIMNKNYDLRVYLSPLSVDEKRIALYNKYHKYMEKKKGWGYREIDKLSYRKSFLSCEVNGAYEVVYKKNDEIVAIDIIDIIDNGISSTYFVYDPKFLHRSLGKFSVYQNIILSRHKKLKWLYLGYYVKDCDSLNYKANFKPFSILKNKPDIEEHAIWESVDN